MKYKGLLFDVDGVLVNSEKVRVEYFQQIFNDKRIKLPNSLNKMILGKSTPVFLQELVSIHLIDKSAADELLSDYNIKVKSVYPLNVEPINETINFIRKYKGNTKIGVATVNTKAKIEQVLKHLQLDKIMTSIISRDDVLNQKPDPECYLKLAEILKLNPRDCAVIEDTANGALASISAGIDCYIFLNSYNSKEEFTGLAIKGFISTTSDLQYLAL